MPSEAQHAKVVITTPYIRLGALLKFCGVLANGGQAKPYLASESVFVNGEREQRRGRKLHPGDVVSASGRDFVVAADGGK